MLKYKNTSNGELQRVYKLEEQFSCFKLFTVFKMI